MPLLEPARSRLLRYGCAVVSVALMTALRLALPVGPRQRFSTFYFAVILTAWYGGLGPSVLAIVLACLSVSFFLLSPLYSFRVFRPGELLGMGLFIAVCSALVAFSEAGRAGRRRLEREVAERRRAEESEREQRERHQTTLASVGDGVIVTDAEGQVVSLNPVAEGLTGWPTAEAVGNPLKQVFRTLDEVTHESSEMPIVQVVQGGVDRQMAQTELVARGGRSLPIEHCTAPIRGEHGAVTGVVIVFRDITERKRAQDALKALESELRSRIAELAEADRRKDEFLATLAHELRNPLAPIRNALHLMREPDGDARAIEPERAMAERQVVHLARLIDDLMDIARINRGKIELRKETLLLAPVVQRAIESVRWALEQRGHHLAITLPEEPISLLADPTRLDQILGNLLNNSIKYTEPGGSIGVVVERQGCHVFVRVRDSGIGIEPELLPRIFDIFVQATDHRDRAQGGLGIGLSLVRRLVEMHGGNITAHSAGTGKGSEFVVRLPVPTASPPGPERPEHEGRPQTGTKPPRRRILVVDDNVDAAESLARLLKRLYGQDVRVSHDGPGALESAAQFFPEVVLLDIGMPGMDGYEVAQRLRQNPNFSPLKLVALTGWGQETDRLRSKVVGFDLHLVKPVDLDALRRFLEG